MTYILIAVSTFRDRILEWDYFLIVKLNFNVNFNWWQRLPFKHLYINIPSLNLWKYVYALWKYIYATTMCYIISFLNLLYFTLSFCFTLLPFGLVESQSFYNFNCIFLIAAEFEQFYIIILFLSIFKVFEV